MSREFIRKIFLFIGRFVIIQLTISAILLYSGLYLKPVLGLNQIFNSVCKNYFEGNSIFFQTADGEERLFKLPKVHYPIKAIEHLGTYDSYLTFINANEFESQIDSESSSKSRSLGIQKFNLKLSVWSLWLTPLIIALSFSLALNYRIRDRFRLGISLLVILIAWRWIIWISLLRYSINNTSILTKQMQSEWSLRIDDFLANSQGAEWIYLSSFAICLLCLLIFHLGFKATKSSPNQ